MRLILAHSSEESCPRSLLWACGEGSTSWRDHVSDKAGVTSQTAKSWVSHRPPQGCTHKRLRTSCKAPLLKSTAPPNSATLRSEPLQTDFWETLIHGVAKRKCSFTPDAFSGLLFALSEVTVVLDNSDFLLSWVYFPPSGQHPSLLCLTPANPHLRCWHCVPSSLGPAAHTSWIWILASPLVHMCPWACRVNVELSCSQLTPCSLLCKPLCQLGVEREAEVVGCGGSLYTTSNYCKVAAFAGLERWSQL